MRPSVSDVSSSPSIGEEESDDDLSSSISALILLLTNVMELLNQLLALFSGGDGGSVATNVFRGMFGK